FPYTTLFRSIYCNKFKNNEIQHFFRILEYDISKVDTQSIGFFLNKVFSKIDMGVCSKYGEFKSVRIEKHGHEDHKDYLYDDYKKFISAKWELLSTVQKKINWYYFKKLINQDMNSFNLLVAETPNVFKEKNDKFRYLLNNQIENVQNYVFDQLIEKAVSDSCKMESLYEDIYNNTKEIEIKSTIEKENPDLLQYFARVEKYKWEKIFKKYVFSESRFDLPNFLRHPNDELYSQAVFDYLTSNHGDLKEIIIEKEKLEKLISSMNKKYFVAYSLYQLLYPDSEEWNDNTVYFKRKLIRIFNYTQKEEKKDLYISSAKIVAKT